MDDIFVPLLILFLIITNQVWKLNYAIRTEKALTYLTYPTIRTDSFMYVLTSYVVRTTY